MTQSLIKEILTITATDLGEEGFDNIYGYGLVNAFEAVNILRNDKSIIGKTITKNGETYYVSNLSDRLRVEWSAVGGITVIPNSPATNQCTLIVSNTSVNATLYADIYYGDIFLRRLYKPIYTSYSGTYNQVACSYHGVNHPAIQTQTLIPNYSHFVHMGCTVYANSPAFMGANVTYFSGMTPEEFYHDSSSQVVRFALPYGSSGIPFHIYVNGDATSNDYHFLFFPFSNNGNITSSLVVEAASNGYNLTINEDNLAMQSESSQYNKKANSGNDFEWVLEAYDTKQGQLAIRTRIKNHSYLLDTSNWKAGTYVLRAILPNSDDVLVEKIQVK